MPLRVRAFRPDDLAAAARLLSARHAAHRDAQRLVGAGDARAFVARELREGARGVVAERGGRVVGYLLGRRGETGVWGRHAWVHRAGHASTDPETMRDLYAAAAERWAAERRRRHFVVERLGRPVGHSILYRPDHRDLGDPERCVYLGHSSIRAELRGRGLGLALTAHVLRWAKDEGYDFMITNWRVANLLASRFWPARGFRRTFLRVERTIRP